MFIVLPNFYYAFSICSSIPLILLKLLTKFVDKCICLRLGNISTALLKKFAFKNTGKFSVGSVPQSVNALKFGFKEYNLFRKVSFKMFESIDLFKSRLALEREFMSQYTHCRLHTLPYSIV